MSNTELLCYILEFQSRSLIVQRLLQAESGVKEYEADWLTNAKVVTRDATGRFASKGSSIKQSVQDVTAILKQGFDLTGDTIQSLLKDPEFRKRAGLAAGLPIAKLISNLATQARLNPKLTEKLDEWIANATKEFADQYGDDKSPMAQAIRNSKLTQPPKDAGFNEKMEFRVAQFAAYKEALESPEDYSKRDEIIGKAAAAAIPIGVSLAIALGFEVAIPLFLAQGVNWATVLSSVAIGEAADFAVQKGMDKLDINNPALRIGASMVAGILAGGLVTGISNKIAFNSDTSLGRNLRDIKHYGDKIKINPKDTNAWYNKAVGLAEIGRGEEAVKVLGEASKANPNDPYLWWKKGEILEELGKYEEAIKSYEEAFKIEPKELRLLTRKGEVLEKLGKYEEAIEYHKKTAEPDEEASPELISLLKKMGRDEEAMELVEKNKIKKAEYIKAKREKWLEYLNGGPSMNYSGNARTLRWKGEVLNDLGRFEEAIKCFNKTLKIDFEEVANAEEILIDKGLSLIGKGISFNGLKKHEEALKIFESALKLYPEWKKTIQENIDDTLAMIQNAKNEIPKILDEAPQVVSKIPAFTPIDPMSLNKVGDLQSAIASLNKEWREQLGLFKGVSTEAKGSESQKITVLRGRLKDLQNKIELHIQNQQ